MKDYTNENLDFSSRASTGVKTIEEFLGIEPVDTSSEKKEGKGAEDYVELPNDMIPLTVKKNSKEKIDPENTPIVGEDEVLEEKEVEKEVEKETVVNTSKINYKEVLSELISLDVFEAFDAIETEEGEQIPFSDLNVDKDTFINIVQQKIEDEKNKALNNTVSTEGVSEFTQRLIEIDKVGGDVQQALHSYQNYKNPLDNLDLTTESGQQAVLAMEYQGSGLGEGEIVRLIQSYKSNGELEDRAYQSKEKIEKAFTAHLDSIEKAAKSRRESHQKELNEYKEVLGTNLKKFNIKESYGKKLIDIATKENTEGEFELDNIYHQMRKDPNQSADLLMFLVDKESYIKQLTEASKREVQLDTMKTLKLVKKGKKDTVHIASKESNREKEYYNIEDITNNK